MKKVSQKQISVDVAMRNTAIALIRDFQNNLMEPGFCCELRTALQSATIPEVRELQPTPTPEMSTAEYKAVYQLQSVFKRYRFESDTYTDEELIAKAIKGFQETQDRLRSQDLGSLGTISNEILDRAAQYIANLLGEYSDEEHRNLCRFGSKASVGIPAAKACEAERWELPLTGSLDQINWFDSEMSHNDSVQDYWRRQSKARHVLPGRNYRVVRSLKLTLVPKTFKSLRSIMPNTTIGSYMSFGLGEMMRLRLLRKGFDLCRLQHRHRLLARQASIDTLMTTADLSAASDSISVALVARLFPPDWYKILVMSRIGLIELPDKTLVESETFGTMGIGYTFPLQTLVFLALLRSIQATMIRRENRGSISVYGDDMIYPTYMHVSAVYFLQKFGFVINIEKTFHEGHFRESCGGDYYHGVDVRPCQPQHGRAYVGNTTYEAVLYKLVNTLLARWTEYEIGNTLNYLTSEIENTVGAVKLVPPDYPDDSGIKCTLRGYNFLASVKCAARKSVGHGRFRFPYLRFVPDYKEEKRHEPYLWVALRGLSLPVFDPTGGLDDQEFLSASVTEINRITGVDRESQPLLKNGGGKTDPARVYKTRERLSPSATYVTVSHTGSYRRQFGSSGFEDRR